MKDFRDLSVWKKAHELSLAIYKASAGFPKDERYGLTSQLRRSCMSVPTNIAEGCGRGSDRDFANFLQIAMGSACEAEYELLLANDLGYLTVESYSPLQERIEEVKRMLTSLLKTLRNAPAKKLTADR